MITTMSTTPTLKFPCDACGSEGMKDRTERQTDEFQLHFGTIACVDRVVNDPQRRDQIRDEVETIYIEMEAAGILD